MNARAPRIAGAIAGILAAALIWPVAARAARAAERHQREAPPPRPAPARTSHLLLDAATERIIERDWDDPDRPLPVGSLIKPFTALAYAGLHRFTYPTVVCRGAADGCWLPAGHGRVGITGAVAGSCNAYFHLLARRTSSEALASTLQWFGMRGGDADADADAAIAPAAMVGLGDGLKLSPLALMHGYLELVARAAQPGVSPIVAGMRASSRTGTGRAVGAAIGQADALVKTGTAPCSHAAKASGDGFALVVYPADRPRIILLVQAHGRTGAETAAVAGEFLVNTLQTR
jgi:hypothetical protein